LSALFEGESTLRSVFLYELGDRRSFLPSPISRKAQSRTQMYDGIIVEPSALDEVFEFRAFAVEFREAGDGTF
jgi:hypothetical protein